MQLLDFPSGNRRLGSVLAVKAKAMFRVAVLVPLVIMVGWMSYVLASSAVVSSSRMASNATFALNSAEGRLRLVMRISPSSIAKAWRPARIPATISAASGQSGIGAT